MPFLRVKPLLVALAMLASFGVGAVVSTIMGQRKPLAVITIQNRSGQPLRSLELQFEGSWARGVLDLPALREGESVEAYIPVRGEGSYVVRAVLFDGVAPELAERYVETGYRVTEVVGQSRIESAAAPIFP